MVKAPTRICVIRHGETFWNADRRIQGHLDIGLNPTGLRQARAAARRLATEAGTVTAV
jgi:probable phosphoglycerate mutase